jgi:tetratricopeptide (TPR) repeat protein
MIATVLFTDIVGSTERATALGDRRWREVLRAHHAAVRDELRRHHGHEIATAGDGFLAVFDSPAHALLCAAAIRAAVKDLELAVRCGLHMGEVEREDGDVGGIAVHIGARIAALAGADEILVSGTVRDAEAGSDFGFEDRGRQTLKGVAGEWRIYALSEIPEAEAAALPPPVEAGLLDRLRAARLGSVALIYAMVAAGILLGTLGLRSVFTLPGWVPVLTVVLLGIGFFVMAATAWVQTRPQTVTRRALGQLPGSREVDLRGVARAVTRGEMPHLTWGRAVAGGVFAFALLFGVAGLYVVIQDRGRSFAPDEALADAAPGIAVLPFSVQGSGLDVWREGAVDLVGSNLDGAAGLRAIDSRTLLARWHETVKEGDQPDLATSLEVARRTGARYALLGSAVALGRDLRLSADVYEVASGKNLGQAQVQGSPDSVYMLVDRLSIEALRTILGGDAQDLPRVELARVTTASLPALKAYLQGEILYRRADWTGALAAYREAVEADSTFALAWRRVAESISWMPVEDRPEGGTLPAVGEAARWSGRLSERESVLVLAERAFHYGSMTMVEPLKAATGRYPDDPELVYLLAEYYAHFEEQLLVSPEETARVLDHAIELDPSFAPFYQHRIEYAFYAADSARALDLTETFERLAGDTREARRYRLAATIAWGSPQESAAALAALDTLPGRELPLCTLFAAPRFQEARRRCATAALEDGGLALHLLGADFDSGRLRELQEVLDAGRGLPAPFIATAALFTLRSRGIPVDSGRLRSLATENEDYPNNWFAAVLAAEDGRTGIVDEELDDWAGFRDSVRAAGDTLLVGQVDAGIQAMRGYVALAGGEREQALRLLQEGQRGLTGWDATVVTNSVLRWTIAGLLVELGRPEEAIPYYRSFRYDPFAAVELGKLYEDLGRIDEAKEQYETALGRWRDADETLAPRVAEVRQRLAGLGFQPRG